MSHQPPGARQPLQTYLQTPVRPVVAQPVSAPVAAPLYAQTSQPAQPQSQQQLFPPAPSHGGLFAPAAVAAPAPVASEHLSTLLGGAPLGPSSLSGGAPAAFRDEGDAASASAGTAGSRQSFSSNSAASPATFASPATSSTPQSIVSPSARLEQTFDHPLLGGGTAPPPAMPSASQPQQAGVVLPGPLGPLGHPPRTPQQQPLQPQQQGRAPRANSISTAQQAGTLVDPLSATAPPAGLRTVQQQPGVAPSPSTAAQAAWAAQQSLAQAQAAAQLQGHPLPAASPSLPPQHQLPQSSPDNEKLSSLLEAFFQGPPPPPKLQAFDVTLHRTLGGMDVLADMGCFRQIVMVAEEVLELPSYNTVVAPTVAVAGKEDAGGKQVLDAAAVYSAAFSSSLGPHQYYRWLHMYLSALIKLRKIDAAQAIVHARVGSCFAQDKLFLSHPGHYPAAAAAGAVGAVAPSSEPALFVGNLLPFELHLLVACLPSQLGKTRLALDQMMKVMQWQRARITRKKNEMKGAAAAAGNNEGAQVTAPQVHRNSISEGGPGSSPNATLSSSTIGVSSQNPFSLSSPHTATPLSLGELEAQLGVARLHVANLCLSFASSLDVDYEQAVAWLNEMLPTRSQRKHTANAGTGAEGSPSFSSEEPEARADPRVLDALVRVHLQAGDLARAEKASRRARRAWQRQGQPQHEMIGLHQVLLHLARNEYAAAFAQSSALLAAHPSSLAVVNNFAVVSLYYSGPPASAGHVSAANTANTAAAPAPVAASPSPLSPVLSEGGMHAGIAALEGLIRRDPVRHLTEATLSNLRALYDLSAQNPALKRRMLDGLVLNYGDDTLDAH